MWCRAFFAFALLLPTLAVARKPPPPPPAAGALDALTRPIPGTFGRVASADREGDPVLEAGGTITLADLEGAGVIDRLWIAIEGGDTFARDIILRIHWEGEDTPSVEAPIGDFFAVGPGARQDLDALPLSVRSGGRSFTSLWRMPFAKRATITLDNEGTSATRVLAWEVDWRTRERAGDPLHFHAVYSQTIDPEPGKALTVVRASGAGHYVGLSVVVQSTAPGSVADGRIRFTVDGDPKRGAGSEPLLRYFGNLFGVGEEGGPYQGATLAEGARPLARTSMYRFHVRDPIPFEESIEVKLDRGAENQRTDRVSAVAYWYQEGVAVPFTKMPPSRDRRWEVPSDELLALWERADELDELIVAAYRSGDLDAARAQLEELLSLEPQNAVASYNLACLYALGEEQDKALHMLQQAVDLGFSELSFARHDPDLVSLHGHERFQKLVGLD